jgi:hypothetical protein
MEGIADGAGAFEPGPIIKADGEIVLNRKIRLKHAYRAIVTILDEADVPDVTRMSEAAAWSSCTAWFSQWQKSAWFCKWLRMCCGLQYRAGTFLVWNSSGSVAPRRTMTIGSIDER